MCILHLSLSSSNASLILEDFNPPLYELPFHKEVHGSETLLSFSSENEKKVFNPGILTSKGVRTSFLPIAWIVKTRARGFILQSLDLHILVGNKMIRDSHC
ncbi:hypothetical protein Tco_1309086 [Tanacetum coccineum]